MGLEAECTARFDGKVSDGKAHLDSNELHFRGTFRLSISLKDVQSVAAENGQLKVTFQDGVATFNLGAQADKWALKLRYPRSLMDKLGVKPGSRIAVIGVKDKSFWDQLRERTSDVADGRPRRGTHLVFFAAEKKEFLKKLDALQRYLRKDGAIWVIRPKGKPQITERDVMAAGKKAGLVDTKVVAFSETHTAEKLVIPVKRR